ncbi:hypothetical protein Ade02nite_34970 [Paractinoplanes deccanensis]|uniref:Uncharacterized protein n=1 Tax=Paractinoplanes deccanensis TaxID=113561 RepID=A0ABQ3Y4F1_9ACTN|nr:hypothetical protein Ade02nite_34970 [Actinoplanes deccanensis]
MPTATAVAAVKLPNAPPTTVVRAARRPYASARLIANNTEGPGMTISTNAASAKAARRSGDGMRPD